MDKIINIFVNLEGAKIIDHIFKIPRLCEFSSYCYKIQTCLKGG